MDSAVSSIERKLARRRVENIYLFPRFHDRPTRRVMRIPAEPMSLAILKKNSPLAMETV